MSLHDRIMLRNRDPNECGDEKEYFECLAYNRALNDAAKIVKEADELINWTRAHLETLRQLADSAASFDEAQIAIKRIDQFKERAQ